MTFRHAVRAVAVASLALVAARASAFEYHGYFRESDAFNSKGGGQVCFALPGSYFKARLGNECDHYLEVSLSETGKYQSIEWKYEFMPAYFQSNGTQATVDPDSNQNSLFVQQSWAGLKFNDWGGATLWAGRRYFRRHDVHSLDWFYWNPGQGNIAVGLEDVNLAGVGKLAITAYRMDASKSNDLTRGVYMTPEIRVYDIAVNPKGTLELGVDLALANDQKVGTGAAAVDALGQDRAGTSPLFTVQHNQAGLLGGSNTLAFQYGSGAFAKESGDGPGQLLAGGQTKDKQWRIIEHLVFNPVSTVSGALVLVYQDISNPATAAGVTGRKIFTGELRPAYHFNDWFKLAADVFYQSISYKDAPSGAGTPTLTKLTVAPTFALGTGYYARPELRFFVTYASWNEAAVTAAGADGIASGAFGTTKSGTTFGAQLETWF